MKLPINVSFDIINYSLFSTLRILFILYIILYDHSSIYEFLHKNLLKIDLSQGSLGQ